MSDPKPTYLELVQALRNLPPRQSIVDQRYWDYLTRVVEPLLTRIPEPK